MSTQWLTVSEVAARLKISERTVQRRCKSGRIAARLETNDDGAAWLIDGATLPTGAATTADTDATVTTGDDKPFESEPAQASTHVAAPDDKVTTSDAIAAGNGFVDHLKAENAFLRGQIEQHARAEAELRAALREALKAMPKAITAPDMSTHAGTAQDDAQRDENSEMGIPIAAAKQTARRPHLTAWQRMAARILGIR